MNTNEELKPDKPGYKYAQLKKDPTKQDVIDYLKLKTRPDFEKWAYDNAYNNVVYPWGVLEKFYDTHVEPLQAEKEELTKKLEFYRSETAKIREFVFNRKDIGYPTQSIFKAITDKLEGLQSENQKLREQLKEIHKLSTYKVNHDEILYDFQEIHKITSQLLKTKTNP